MLIPKYVLFLTICYCSILATHSYRISLSISQIKHRTVMKQNVTNISGKLCLGILINRLNIESEISRTAYSGDLVPLPKLPF